MSKPIVKPRIYTLKAAYKVYAIKLLKDNPTWWSMYDKNLHMTNGIIYSREKGLRILRMSWVIYQEIATRFYHAAKDAIIQGETLILGSRLGKLRATRIQRNFKTLTLDYGEMWKQKIYKDGKLVKIYHTDDDYCRIQWKRFTNEYSIPNQTGYYFQPAALNSTNKKGFKKEFVSALKADPELKYKYYYQPLRPFPYSQKFLNNTENAVQVHKS